MPAGLSGGRLAVYAGLGVVLLLLGIRALGGEGGEAASAGPASGLEVASEPVSDGGAEAGAGSGDLVVHVAGMVRKPGVYRLPAGARVSQAIERAGGPRARAQPDGINLAARLSDGQQVVVPGAPTDGAASAGVAAGGAEDGPISLGSASVADLEQIAGIGPVTAEKIVAFRDQQGGIGAVEELDAVPGIGPATLESLSERLQP
jgi:competence protein ComEA